MRNAHASTLNRPPLILRSVQEVSKTTLIASISQKIAIGARKRRTSFRKIARTLCIAARLGESDEDRTERHRGAGDVERVRECGSRALGIELRIDEAQHSAQRFGTKPLGGPALRDGWSAIEGDHDLAETRAERFELLRK